MRCPSDEDPSTSRGGPLAPDRHPKLVSGFTQFANASCGTIRLKLLKIGARVTLSVRRVKIAMASAYPWRDECELAHLALRTAAGR